jgi:type IV pilus assembly protein PilM
MPKPGKTVGLDLGLHSVKAVWAEQRGAKTACTRTEILLLPREGGNPAAVIEPWIRQVGLSGASCVIGIPGDQCMFQPLLMAPNDPRDPAQAAAMEVVQFNEMASETMSYSFAPLSLNSVESRLVLAMVRPTLLETMLARATDLGVRVVDVVPLPVALYNSMEQIVDRHDEPYMAIHIGHATTEVSIGSSGGFMFGRAFSSGGNMFTDAVAKARAIPFAQAEALKVESAGLGESESGDGLAAVADLWLTEIQSCLSVYRSGYPERTSGVQRILLSGGSAALPGLARHVQDQLGIATVVADALPDGTPSDQPATYVVAAGLALSGLEAPATSLSLLPEHMRNEQSFRTQKPYWIAAAVTAALILGVSLVGGFRDQKRKESHLHVVSVNLKKMQDLKQDIEVVRAQNKQLRSLAEPVSAMLHAGPLMRDLITLVANRMDTDDWLDMVCDAESYFSPTAFSDLSHVKGVRGRHHKSRTDKEKVADDRFRHIIIQGYTRTPDLSTVKSLLIKLEDTDFVERADLLGDDRVIFSLVSTNTPRDPRAKVFVIELALAESNE